MVDYSIEDIFIVLNNIKNNPYGVNDSKHLFKRCNERNIDINQVFLKVYTEIPVGIQKTHKTSNKFELIYEYTNSEDLYVIINIDNLEELTIITCIRNSVTKREHD